MQQRDNIDLARVLLSRAIDEETLVRTVAENPDIADAIVGFHLQQASEKLIKAVLAAHGMVFARSHDLEYLIGLLAEGRIDAPDDIEEAETLAAWAVEFRYEGEEPPALDRAGSLTLVEELKVWAEGAIAKAAERRGDSDEQQGGSQSSKAAPTEAPTSLE